ncbi:TRAP transporter small permease subunit [Ferrovibrio sp.]|uniref:TRAP transporter small permease n=1 Tax=Ferrovibrio sp. TaxID=1917215 RepID=UPI00311E0D56
MTMIVRVSDWLNSIVRAAAGLSLVVMVVLLGIQVVARYLFSDPPAWTEEGARYAMVWAGLLGATMAFRAGSDPVLLNLPALQSGVAGIAARLLRAAAVLLFLLPIWWYCIFGPNADPARGFVARSMARDTESMGLSMAWFTMALPLSISIIGVHLLAQLAGQRNPLHHPEDPS